MNILGTAKTAFNILSTTVKGTGKILGMASTPFSWTYNYVTGNNKPVAPTATTHSQNRSHIMNTSSDSDSDYDSDDDSDYDSDNDAHNPITVNHHRAPAVRYTTRSPVRPASTQHTSEFQRNLAQISNNQYSNPNVFLSVLKACTQQSTPDKPEETKSSWAEQFYPGKIANTLTQWGKNGADFWLSGPYATILARSAFGAVANTALDHAGVLGKIAYHGVAVPAAEHIIGPAASKWGSWLSDNVAIPTVTMGASMLGLSKANATPAPIASTQNNINPQEQANIVAFQRELRTLSAQQFPNESVFTAAVNELMRVRNIDLSKVQKATLKIAAPRPATQAQPNTTTSAGTGSILDSFSWENVASAALSAAANGALIWVAGPYAAIATRGVCNYAASSVLNQNTLLGNALYYGVAVPAREHLVSPYALKWGPTVAKATFVNAVPVVNNTLTQVVDKGSSVINSLGKKLSDVKQRLSILNPVSATTASARVETVTPNANATMAPTPVVTIPVVATARQESPKAAARG